MQVEKISDVIMHPLSVTDFKTSLPSRFAELFPITPLTRLPVGDIIGIITRNSRSTLLDETFLSAYLWAHSYAYPDTASRFLIQGLYKAKGIDIRNLSEPQKLPYLQIMLSLYASFIGGKISNGFNDGSPRSIQGLYHQTRVGDIVAFSYKPVDVEVIDPQTGKKIPSVLIPAAMPSHSLRGNKIAELNTAICHPIIKIPPNGFGETAQRWQQIRGVPSDLETHQLVGISDYFAY